MAYINGFVYVFRRIALRTAAIIVLIPMTSQYALGRTQRQTVPPIFVVVPSPHYSIDQTIYLYERGFIADNLNYRLRIWRSDNGGNSWMKKVELFDPYQAYGAVHVGEPSIGSDSPAIYFAFYRGLPEGNYLWSSTDGGDTWQIRNSPRQYNCTYPVLTTDPSVLFVSCVPYWQYTTAGIFRSMDAGISWESLLSTTGIYPLIPSPDFINDHIVFAGLNHSTTIPEQTDLMISLDQGTHWQARDQGLCDAAITAMVLSPDFSEDSTLFVMQNRELIFKSQDAGITWVQLYSDSGASCESSGSGYGHELYVSPDYAQDTTLFSSNSDGLYASYDDGLTWQHLDNHPLNSLFIYRRTDVNTETAPAEPAASQAVPRTDHSVFLPLVALRGPQRLPLTLFATRSNGLPYRSDDGGVTWRPLPLPPWAEQFLPLVMIQ